MQRAIISARTYPSDGDSSPSNTLCGRSRRTNVGEVSHRVQKHIGQECGEKRRPHHPNNRQPIHLEHPCSRCLAVIAEPRVHLIYVKDAKSPTRGLGAARVGPAQWRRRGNPPTMSCGTHTLTFSRQDSYFIGTSCRRHFRRTQLNVYEVKQMFLEMRDMK